MTKTNRIALTGVLLALLGVAACSDDGNLGGTAGPGGSSGDTPNSSGGVIPDGEAGAEGGAPRAVETVKGEIAANRTLTADKRYLLEGLVTVKAGATLTIEKGTTIMGDNASKAILLVEPGAKIHAEGTADEPIVFTSQAAEGVRRAGDWGGLVLLGKAPVNYPGGKGNVEGILKTSGGTEFGGTDANDDSGVLRYVRIEYAGVVLSPDNEVNGVTFAGVGRGTKVDHVMVRHALDDCFEFFGGTVDAHHLVCQYNQDDGFDFDNGYTGRLQFLVLQQDPKHAGEDNGIESDNDAQGSANTPMTSPTLFNVTLCGKNADPASAQFGLLLRKNTRGSFNNMIVTGFEAGFDVRDVSTAASATAGALSIKGSWFWGSVGKDVVESFAFPETGADAPNKNNDGAFDEVLFAKTPGAGNQSKDPMLDCFNATAPRFSPAAALTEGAVTPPNDGFFDASAAWVGAFKDASDAWATTGEWAAWSDR